MSDLEESFEALDLEEGLLFVEKPVVGLKLTRYPNEVINVKVNSELVIVCHAEGFPKPTYEYFKSGERISSSGTLRKSATVQDGGDYKCIISQSQCGDVYREEVLFKVVIARGFY